MDEDRFNENQIKHYETDCMPNLWEMNTERTWDGIYIDWSRPVYWDIWGVCGGNHFTENEEAQWDFLQMLGSIVLGVVVAAAAVACGVTGWGAVAAVVLMELSYNLLCSSWKEWLKEDQQWHDEFGYVLTRSRMRIYKTPDFSASIDWKEYSNPTQNLDTWTWVRIIGEVARGRPYDVELYPISINAKRLNWIRITFTTDESKIHSCNIYSWGSDFPDSDDYWSTNTPLNNIGTFEVDLSSAGNGPGNILKFYREKWESANGEDVPRGIPILSIKIEPIVDFEVEDGFFDENFQGYYYSQQEFSASVDTRSLGVSPSWDDSQTISIRFDGTPTWGAGAAIILAIALASGDAKIQIGEFYTYIREHFPGQPNWPGDPPQPPQPPGDGFYWERYEAIWYSHAEGPIIAPNLPEPKVEPVVPEPNFEPAFDPAFEIPDNFEIKFVPEDWDETYSYDTEIIEIFDPTFDLIITFPDTTTTIAIEDADTPEPSITINSEDRSAIIIPGQNSEGQTVRMMDPDNVAKIDVSGGIVYDKIGVNLYEPEETVYVDIAAETETKITILESDSQPKVPLESEISVCVNVESGLTTEVNFYSGLYANPEIKIADGTLTTTPTVSYTTYTDLSLLSLSIDKSDNPPLLSIVEPGVATPLIDIALEIYGNHLKPLYWIEDSTFAWRYDYERYVPSDPDEITIIFTMSGYSTYPLYAPLYGGLSNTGSKQDTIDLEVGNIPQGWSATLKDEVGVELNQITLDAEHTIPLFLEITLPPSPDPNQIQYIWVKSTSSADPTEWDYVAFKVVIVNEIDTIWYPDLTSEINEHEVLNLIYPPGGNEETFYLKVPKTADIRMPIMMLTGSDIHSNYPSNILMDIGNDGDIEWRYGIEELSTNVIIPFSSYGRYRIITDAIQEYIDTHQPDDSSGFVHVPVKISSETEGCLTIADISIQYRFKWATGKFSKLHENPNCYYNSFTAELYYTGSGGIDIDESLCPYISYSITIDDQEWERPALIEHNYYDENNDGIIDDTSIPELSLVMYWWDINGLSWVPVGDLYGWDETGVDGSENVVWANVEHFSYYSAKGSYVPILESEILIDTLIDMNMDEGIKNSLLVKLNTALDNLNLALDHFIIGNIEEGNGNLVVADVKFNDFINEVNAQRGKKISEDDADILITNTQDIIILINEAFVPHGS
jgi:hypothetical protein